MLLLFYFFLIVLYLIANTKNLMIFFIGFIEMNLKIIYLILYVNLYGC